MKGPEEMAIWEAFEEDWQRRAFDAYMELPIRYMRALARERGCNVARYRKKIELAKRMVEHDTKTGGKADWEI